MAIIGAHILLYTPEPEAVRAVLRDVFGFAHVDAGQGWLIFRLPPAELGIHPAEETGPGAVAHAFSLMCDDVHATVRELRAKGVQIDGEPQDHGYGITVMVTLPGGLRVQIYEPRHPVAIDLDT
jgi:catechol 2,3-dioxygenase-like lactoylglutathione lyase family enzyme